MYSHHSKNGTNQATQTEIPKRDAGDILLEIGDWKLIKARFPLLIGVDSFPVHMCGKSPEGYGVHNDEGKGPTWPGKQCRRGRCIKCNQHMPDEIAGLWTLHNWEVATK